MIGVSSHESNMFSLLGLTYEKFTVYTQLCVDDNQSNLDNEKSCSQIDRYFHYKKEFTSRNLHPCESVDVYLEGLKKIMALFGRKPERDSPCAFVVESSRMDIIPIDLLLSLISDTVGLQKDKSWQEQKKDCKRIQSHLPHETYETALSAINSAALIIWQTTASVDFLKRRELWIAQIRSPCCYCIVDIRI